MGVFGVRIFHRASPEFFAVKAIEANERALLFLFQRLCQENLFAPHDGRAVAAIGELNFPRDVFGGAPFKRQVFLRGDAHARGPAPHGPVVGLQSDR